MYYCIPSPQGDAGPVASKVRCLYSKTEDEKLSSSPSWTIRSARAVSDDDCDSTVVGSRRADG